MDLGLRDAAMNQQSHLRLAPLSSVGHPGEAPSAVHLGNLSTPPLAKGPGHWKFPDRYSSSRLRSIQAVFSWTSSRWVSRSAVG